MQTGLILGIESSCDETAAAVVRAGAEVRSNVVASQIAMHAVYGGVVPELASREHLRNIVPTVQEALHRADVQLRDIDAIAVTEGPGLAGALLVGITYAKSLAYALGKPLIAVNHLEGHIHAVLLEMREHHRDQFATPILALVVSGGHTHLYLATETANTWHYRNVGRTIDDAAGEAFDKVAKLLGLGYPGGPWIDRLAPHGDPKLVDFRMAQIKTKPHLAASETAQAQDFSFSGIKTAVLRYVETHNLKPTIDTRRDALAAIANPTLDNLLPLCDAQTLGLIASFQRAVVEYLRRNTFAAAEALGAQGILVSGGVAANSELRTRFTAEAEKRGLPIAFPSLSLATDNAAMIAAAAWPKLQRKDFAGDELNATAQLKLG